MDKFQPATVPAHVIRTPGDGSARIDPNPIFAELQRMGPPPKPVRKMHQPRKPKPPNDAAAPPAAETSFPNPTPAAAPAAAAAPPPPPPAR